MTRFCFSSWSPICFCETAIFIPLLQIDMYYKRISFDRKYRNITPANFKFYLPLYPNFSFPFYIIVIYSDSPMQLHFARNSFSSTT
jgi:hypothetical protein